MINSPRVAIVIVNCNKRNYLLPLLGSLRNLDYKNCDTVVVDNASSDGSVEAMKELFSEIDLIENPVNLGAAEGGNIGMKHALNKEPYKYIWLLDDDALIERDTLTKLIKVMEGDDKIGICGCAFYEYQNKNFLVDCGSFVTRNGGLRGFSGENVELQREPYEVDFVITASALIRTQALKQVDFLDERYFFDWEDIDFCITLKKYGYKVVSVPDAKVYHKPFLPGERPLNFYYSFRNRLLFIGKYLGSWQRVSTIYSISKNMMKILIYSYLQNREEDVNKIKFAILDFMKDRWGERKFKTFNDPTEGITIEEVTKTLKKSKGTRFLILPSGNKNEINQLLLDLSEIINESNRDWSIKLLLQKKRVPLIKSNLADEVITESFTRTKSPLIITKVAEFLRIVLYKFDVAIDTAPREVLIYYYALPRVYRWNSKTKLFYLSTENIFQIWKLPLAFALGEISALLIFPLVLIKSFSYRIKD
jgi:GT2 family glycosyltransferase